MNGARVGKNQSECCPPVKVAASHFFLWIHARRQKGKLSQPGRFKHATEWKDVSWRNRQARLNCEMVRWSKNSNSQQCKHQLQPRMSKFCYLENNYISCQITRTVAMADHEPVNTIYSPIDPTSQLHFVWPKQSDITMISYRIIWYDITLNDRTLYVIMQNDITSHNVQSHII